jgi:biopolymer transport protein ExbB/TolQ
MRRFTEILRGAAERLDLPQPTKSNVLLELAADLEDLFLHYRSQGQDEEEAIRMVTIRDAIALSTGKDLARMQSGNGSGAILFWGCIAAVLGVLGSLNALYLSLWSIRQVGAANPSLVAEGLAVALITTIFGLLILACSAVAWFTLRWWLQRVHLRGGGHTAAAA